MKRATDHRTFPPVTSGQWLDRLAVAIVWLVMLNFVIIIGRDVVLGTTGSAGMFSLDDLWIRYEIRSGGLVPERLEYVIVTPRHPSHQLRKQSRDTYTFVFAGTEPVTVRPKRGETVWIDAQGGVTHLGPVLASNDVNRLRDLSNSDKLTVSSEDEFLSLVGEMTTGTASRDGVDRRR